MISKECFVYIQLPESHEMTTLGRLKWEKTGHQSVGTFVYGRRYLETPKAIALDPFNLPLEERQFECVINSGIFGPIRDASPDTWGRYIIEKNIPNSEWDEIGYLINSAEDRVGALSFGNGKEPPTPLKQFNQTIQLANLIEATHKIEKNEPISSAERTILMAGVSMGGARPKTVVEHKGNLWLAKFPSYNDKNNFSKIEFATMKMAKDCGIRVPDIELAQVGTEDVFLIKRFDRDWDEKSNGYFRKHFVSGLTLLNQDEQDVKSWSYLDLAEQMRRWISDPKNDLRELYRRIIFNALISNEDDHPRNHGFIYHSKGGYHLSMVYDLVPRPGTGTSRYSAMAIGEFGRGFTKKNIFSRCKVFEYDRDEAETLFADLTAKVSKWRRYYQEVKLPDSDFTYLESAFNWEGLEY